MAACQVTRRSRSPTTPAGSTPAATGWPRWWAACSGTWRSAILESRASAELADALLASRSAIAGAVNTLETLGLIQRSRAAGERMDRVRIDMSSPHATGFDISEYQEQGELAREGLRLLADAPPERRAILLEWAAFADFLVGAASRAGAGVEGTAGGAASRRRAPRRPGSSPRGQKRHDEPDQHAGDRGPGRVQVVRQPSGARQGEPDRGGGHDPRAAGSERGRQDHDGPHPLHPDPGRLRLHAHRRSRRGHRPRRGAGASSGSPASSRPWTTCSPGPRTCG